MSRSFDHGFRDDVDGQSQELTDLTGLLNRETEENLPNTRVERTQETSSPAKKTTRFSGWRVGASYFALGALISLVVHVVLAVWIPTLDSFDNGVGVLWTGNCRDAATYNTLIHLGTTAVATLLLGGSNYCMQCLTAPTRKDLQTAHDKGVWLDIGVQSFRNLKAIKGYKAVLWFLIAISSIPIHLLYNSAFFMTLDTNSYQVYVVSRDFWNSTDPVPVRLTPPIHKDVHGRGWGRGEEQQLPPNATEYLNSVKASQSRPGSAEENDVGNFKRLSNEQCIDAYAQSVVSGRRTIIVTAANETEKGPFAFGYEYLAGKHVNTTLGMYRPYEWMCYGFRPAYESESLCYESIHNLTQQPEQWAPWFLPARHCHSEVVEGNCALNANQPIMVVIIICTSIKLIIMAMMVFLINGWPIITLGDAIQSFLDDPDPTTEGFCLLSKNAVTSRSPFWPKKEPLDEPDPIISRRRRHRWSDAASTRRWLYTLTILGVSLMVIIIFFGLSIDSMKDNNTVDPFSIRFGSVDAAAVITYWAVSTYSK
ncbi:hypothetical protein NCS55_00459500 [Fusarium keratoplasticum]|nr:hypothetical protein NCS55_00459500 [Fusarium keratoplasticum]